MLDCKEKLKSSEEQLQIASQQKFGKLFSQDCDK